MKALTKAHQKEREQLIDEIEVAENDLRNAINDFNEALKEHWTDVNEALDKYNGTVDKARDWLHDKLTDMEDYYESRSDKWKSADEGSAYQEWISNFEEIDPQNISMTMPEPLEDPIEEDYANELVDLPDTP